MEENKNDNLQGLKKDLESDQDNSVQPESSNQDDQDKMVDETEQSKVLREALGEQFKSKIAPAIENLDEDEDVKEFINQKGNVDIVKKPVPEQVFNPVKPAEKSRYVWTIILIILIIIALTAIVILVMSGKGGKDVSKQEQLMAYNEQKSKFDKIFVGAVNNLSEAEADFNVKKYVIANDKAKEAENDFSEATDFLYDVGAVSLSGDEFKFLSGYFDKLEETTDLGEKMANTLAYVARSADRGEFTDAEKNLAKYHDYADEMADLMDELDKIKKLNKEFFEE